MKRSSSLFEEMAPRAPRKAGILSSQEIHELIRNGKIRSSAEISDDQIQPASIDLRLGSKAYCVRASFLPSGSYAVGPKIRELLEEEIDLTHGGVLQPNRVYIVPVIESLDLPSDMSGKANPKSTTGRLDVFTRLMTEKGMGFEQVPKGYKGNLYVEVVPRTFAISVKEGTKLNQLRLFRGNTEIDDERLRKVDQKRPLVYCQDSDRPVAPVINNGLRISVDLQGDGPESIVAYRAKDNRTPIDLSKVGGYNTADFWDAIQAKDAKNLILHPGRFYLMASRERMRVPPDYSAEMEPYDPSIGEFTVHYAGFFDPGFGFGSDGEIKGTKAVLEVRAHELPILLENAQEVCRLVYHEMAEDPEKVYGQAIGSSYQKQGLALSKQFKASANAQAAIAREA